MMYEMAGSNAAAGQDEAVRVLLWVKLSLRRRDKIKSSQ
jgi:hypothetical protein